LVTAIRSKSKNTEGGGRSEGGKSGASVAQSQGQRQKSRPALPVQKKGKEGTGQGGNMGTWHLTMTEPKHQDKRVECRAKFIMVSKKGFKGKNEPSFRIGGIMKERGAGVQTLACKSGTRGEVWELGGMVKASFLPSETGSTATKKRRARKTKSRRVGRTQRP